ncbi:MAG: hypothetical protein ACON5F_00130 [Jejuia sp.]
MRYLLVCLIVLLISCGNERELQLPQIDKAEITEIQDVSAAYLFYDETQPDSVLLNRKNLISTTNWLVNVDKRLTLKQAIPHIKFLQSKKKSSSHKNQDAKNYFTCHDLSINNLGFLEFTNLIYNHDKALMDSKKDSLIMNDQYYGLKKDEHLKGILEHVTLEIYLYFEENNLIYGNYYMGRGDIHLLRKNSINEYLKAIDSFLQPLNFKITANFDADLTFQKYIDYKMLLTSLEGENVKVSNDELILN